MEKPGTGSPLADYEAHMSLENVAQLQAMDALMERQFRLGAAETALVFGVAGGNGVRRGKGLKRIYGIDINPEYLTACRKRLADLGERFVPLLMDVTDPNCVLPEAELVIANLFVEYVGYRAFTQALEKVSPQWVSVGIQQNEGPSFVCDSPYLHVFDRLEKVHVQMEEGPLTEALEAAGFHLTGRSRIPLPQGKALLGLNYEHI